MKRGTNIFWNVIVGLAGVLALASATAQDRPTISGPGASTNLPPPVKRVPQTTGRIQVPLPDLRPTGIVIRSEGGEIVVNVDVANVGNADSAATSGRTILVTVPIQNPATGRAWYPPGSNIAQSQALWNSLPAIPAGQTRRVYAGTARLPNRSQDWDVAFETHVDVPPPGQPRGHILEANENNNTLYRPSCRVYGPNPNLSGPPSCR